MAHELKKAGEMEIADAIGEVLMNWGLWPDLDEDPNEDTEIDLIHSFEEAGVLTMDKGIVIELMNGQKFAVTVQEMRRR